MPLICKRPLSGTNRVHRLCCRQSPRRSKCRHRHRLPSKSVRTLTVARPRLSRMTRVHPKALILKPSTKSECALGRPTAPLRRAQMTRRRLLAERSATTSEKCGRSLLQKVGRTADGGGSTNESGNIGASAKYAKIGRQFSSCQPQFTRQLRSNECGRTEDQNEHSDCTRAGRSSDPRPGRV